MSRARCDVRGARCDTDPFDDLVVAETDDDFAALTRRRATSAEVAAPALPAAVTARLHGFDLEDQPLLTAVPGLPGEVVAARTAVSLTRAQVGSSVVLVFEGGNVRRPIVLGVLHNRTRDVAPAAPASAAPVIVQADDERLALSAEREITLRCGRASITLTRAGKVIIKGAYIVSHSSGHNRIKGAAVDIN